MKAFLTIVTATGAQVDEDTLCEVFAKCPDLTALLDVTHPEPPDESFPLYKFPNIFIQSYCRIL
ncbi:MAG: hypothetical protein GY750_04720 [Lentisphaerae bacterium]|nr:hypothetical protein [Lentisphaerota bacterium]MCP4100715.1 hypothetical protein [Lentisphaerota bacterium]